ncbi:MAG: ABC transporter permease [Desulfobacterales bacterium]|nr:ABC transporter permease [Desulfobacterales bacterium]
MLLSRRRGAGRAARSATPATWRDRPALPGAAGRRAGLGGACSRSADRGRERRGVRPAAGAARGAARPGASRWPGGAEPCARPTSCSFTGARCIAHRHAQRCSRALGIAVGVAAVMLLTSIGEGVRRFVVAEFTQFGTNLISIDAGHDADHGRLGRRASASVRPLTIDDAEALRARAVRDRRRCRWCRATPRSRRNGRKRRVTVYGVGPDFADGVPLRRRAAAASCRRTTRARRAASPCSARRWRSELFGDANALGANVRVGGERYRVVGVMRAEGHDDRLRPRRHGVHPGGARAGAVQPRRACSRSTCCTRRVRRSTRWWRASRACSSPATATRTSPSRTQQQMLDTLGVGARRADLRGRPRSAASRCWSAPSASSPS